MPEIISNIKSIKTVVVINYPGKKYLKFNKIKNVKIYKVSSIMKNKFTKIKFRKFDFDHELTILYSSGTTKENLNVYVTEQVEFCYNM